MVDENTVKKVAETARISLTKKEVLELRGELNQILKSFAVLDKADTRGVEPAFQPIPVKNVTRKDVVEPSLPRKRALANTKNKEGPYFTGPKTL